MATHASSSFGSLSLHGHMLGRALGQQCVPRGGFSKIEGAPPSVSHGAVHSDYLWRCLSNMYTCLHEWQLMQHLLLATFLCMGTCWGEHWVNSACHKGGVQQNWGDPLPAVSLGVVRISIIQGSASTICTHACMSGNSCNIFL